MPNIASSKDGSDKRSSAKKHMIPIEMYAYNMKIGDTILKVKKRLFAIWCG